MTEKKLYEILKKTNLPVAYRKFRQNKKPEPPYIIYIHDSTENIFADDKKYIAKKNIIVMLYTQNKNFELESQIEKILEENEILYESDEDYLDDEKLNETSYLFQI